MALPSRMSNLEYTRKETSRRENRATKFINPHDITWNFGANNIRIRGNTLSVHIKVDNTEFSHEFHIRNFRVYTRAKVNGLHFNTNDGAYEGHISVSSFNVTPEIMVEYAKTMFPNNDADDMQVLIMSSQIPKDMYDSFSTMIQVEEVKMKKRIAEYLSPTIRKHALAGRTLRRKNSGGAGAGAGAGASTRIMGGRRRKSVTRRNHRD